jgi:hypothetical protein
MVRFHTSPDVAIAPVTRRFFCILLAFLFGQLPEKRMAKHVRRDFEALSVFAMRVRLVCHTVQRFEKLHP